MALAFGLSLPVSAAQSVTLAWNPNTETNLAGYRLYYGLASRSYSSIVPVIVPSTQATVANVQPGQTYYFAVTAYTTDGLESDYSDEVSYTVPGDGGGGGGGGTGGTNEVIFLAAAGTYSGLIAETDEVRHERSGSFTLTSTSRGSYSGKVLLGGKRYSIKGLLGSDARTTNVVLRGGLSSLGVELAFDTGTHRISGRVTDGSWVAQLLADRQAFHAKTNPAPFAGTYTIGIPADEQASDAPDGDGYGTVKIDTKGLASFVGMLADGSKATQKVPLSAEGHWPFHLNLYRGGGSALGWLAVSNATDEVGGLVSWIKPAVAGKYYAGGLTNESMVLGSAYVRPSSNPADVRRTEIVCAGGNFSGPLTDQVTLLANGKMVSPGPGGVKIGVSPTTGLFRGTVIDPGSGRPWVLSGVILQKWNLGVGLILGTNEVGRVELTLE